jgi:hypothetical protein
MIEVNLKQWSTCGFRGVQKELQCRFYAQSLNRHRKPQELCLSTKNLRAGPTRSIPTVRWTTESTAWNFVCVVVSLRLLKDVWWSHLTVNVVMQMDSDLQTNADQAMVRALELSELTAINPLDGYVTYLGVFNRPEQSGVHQDSCWLPELSSASSKAILAGSNSFYTESWLPIATCCWTTNMYLIKKWLSHTKNVKATFFSLYVVFSYTLSTMSC